ncbi:alpha tubulin suppressor [Savitreella phatthalungensis]
MLVLGSNGSGQLGTSHDRDVHAVERVVLPAELDGAKPAVVCGGNHTLLMTRGHVYAAGSNLHGELGLGEISGLSQFTRIHAERQWALAACGFAFSVLVSTDGEIYSTGECSKGSLGIDQDVARRLTFVARHDVIEIKAGIDHVIARLRDGTLLGWGNGRRGALGPQYLSLRRKPDVIGERSMIQELCCGNGWTCLLFEDGRLELLGSNRWISAAPAGHFCSIAANWSTLHAMTPAGQIISIGRADRGQCRPEGLPQAKLLASGSEHAGIITRDNLVYLWGWNEHGSCGDTSLQDVVKAKILSVEPQSALILGYGTTFLFPTIPAGQVPESAIPYS